MLRETRWMIMPLRECAAAPAQGALAVECRADDEDTFAKVSRIHDATTAASVARERAWLERWGGGCHQRFGATHIAHAAFADGILFMAGRNPADELCDRLEWAIPARPAGEIRAWSGVEWRKTATKGKARGAQPINGAVFVAHSRAWEGLPSSPAARVWVSGTSSWSALARQGVWVEGSAEGLGYQWIRGLLAEPVLGLPEESAWSILTHEAAREDWPGRAVQATYSVQELAYPPEALSALQAATHVYWGSASQREALAAQVPAGALEACGPGKTAENLRRQGIPATIFPSAEEWTQWLRKTR